MTPVETNTFWYTLGGVLAISLVLEIATGMLLALRYLPDAGQAFQITEKLLDEGGWSVALNFHYWNGYVIFALVMIPYVAGVSQRRLPWAPQGAVADRGGAGRQRVPAQPDRGDPALG